MEKKLSLEMIKFIILSALAFSHSICQADSNRFSGLQCSEADDSASDNPFQENLSILLNKISINGPVDKGFFRSSTGRNQDKLYGLVQCRGDVPAGNCSSCIQECIKKSFQDCPKSTSVKIWFTWCFLRYSKDNFLGVWDQSSTAEYNDTYVDDASVGSKGLIFMTQLAETAAESRMMFRTRVLDVGKSGKRYGLAQCTRDISFRDCDKCLDAELVTFRSLVGNKRGWEIYGSSCSMWYHDFQFYFNPSPASNGAGRFSLDGAAIGIATGMLLFLLALQ